MDRLKYEKKVLLFNIFLFFDGSAAILPSSESLTYLMLFCVCYKTILIKVIITYIILQTDTKLDLFEDLW
jgi:hypothetical protein